MSETRGSAWPIELAMLRVRERSGSICILRIGRDDGTLAEPLGRAFDVSWPVEPNTTAAHGDLTVLWMAPGQWAIMDCPAASVTERATDACGSMLHLVSDVTDGRVSFEISGALSRDLLAKGCSLDLHPRAFKPGACAQTLLAQVPVLLYRPREAPDDDAIFHLYADVSVAWHLRSWFQDAALEFTIRPPMGGTI